MASLHYLTVQDVLWINLQVTKKVHRFDYARLEEAAFYQYAYGESNTLLKQAARFVGGFMKMQPFEAGNEGTTLVACLAFLEINGYAVTANPDQLSTWSARAAKGCEESMIAEIAVADEKAHHTLVPDIRGAVQRILERYTDSLDMPRNPSAA